VTPSKATRARYDEPANSQGYHARRYGDLEGRLNLSAMRSTLNRALVGVPPGSRVLDLPCGTGQYCWHIAAAGFQTTAADIAPEMLKVASSSGTATATHAPEFMVENVFQLSFPARSFAASVCIRFFNLLKRSERIAALTQLARVSDTVIVSYNHPYTIKHLSRLVRHRLGLRSRPRERLSRECVRSEASEAGLELQKLFWVTPLLSEVWLAVLAKPGAN
jgi:2-polyprenyl-3-methyl-5-hydroxy-6-metoxy-1,4-benzoquinol methylase